jgi:hypothetical protein
MIDPRVANLATILAVAMSETTEGAPPPRR